ncbi:dihydroxyacetone kinase subunit DhaL [Sediminispirochaeta bajacaliforniensis]|uniref:dihydroxyacetone kinase subunit DhaL n=1 Tax=Sediminispirochaeta bajacaliforniensis TaxID=148 RepID=UPI00037E43B3|nr:dihydroxyacetone kinase subunit DhaL [Sediminispirochaeta bajacaliforniensis]
MLTLEMTEKWLRELGRVYAEQKEYLTRLDSEIGDADHGINMNRGFSAVCAELDKQSPSSISAALKSTAFVLIRTVGGASGPLYGSFFLDFSKALDGKDTAESADVAAAFRAGLEAIKKRGKAHVGDKTMLDALVPAVEKMEVLAGEGKDISTLLGGAVEAAEAGLASTIEMVAKKGRASYLGERSKGHQDPGATSSCYLLKAALETWK